MGITDNGRLFCLPEYLGEGKTGYNLSSNHIGKNISRPNRRKLVSISNKHQLTIFRDCCKKCGSQTDIKHGTLVHNKTVHSKRSILTHLKTATLKFQQSVDGLCLHADHFSHPLGGPAGGCGKNHLLPHGLEEFHQSMGGGCFSTAGPPGKDGTTTGDDSSHTCPLLRTELQTFMSLMKIQPILNTFWVYIKTHAEP